MPAVHPQTGERLSRPYPVKKGDPGIKAALFTPPQPPQPHLSVVAAVSQQGPPDEEWVCEEFDEADDGELFDGFESLDEA